MNIIKVVIRLVRNKSYNSEKKEIKVTEQIQNYPYILFLI